NSSNNSHSREHVLSFYRDHIWVLVPYRIRSHTELLVHDGHQHLSTTKHNASHTIGILKKIDRFSVGPVILPGRFAHNTREDEDDAEEPDVPQTYSSTLLFHLRNTLITKIRSHYAKDNQQWKNCRKLEEKISHRCTDHHNDPGDRIPDRIRKCSEAGIQQ